MSEVVLAVILAFFALLGGLGVGAFLFRRKEKEPTKTFEEDVQKILENAQREAERIINLAKEEAQRVRQEAEERKREVEGLALSKACRP
jgi:ribonuclease Y